MAKPAVFPENYFVDLNALRAGDVVLRHDDPERGPGWKVFREASTILTATSPDDVVRCLENACEHARRGWSAGFMTYEASAGLGERFAVQTPDWPVLAWFALFDSPPRFCRELLPVYQPMEVSDLSSDWDPSAYGSAFAKVKDALAAGESYQVNLTFRQRFGHAGTPAEFFSSRCGVDPPRYAAFIQGGGWQVASFSPELLFERLGDLVVATPMKGTAPIGETRAESALAARRLVEDPKSRAENIMIVDMVRNDLGSVCEVGSVETPRLLAVERHRGLLQMVSSVTGRCSAPSQDLIRALFPAASITGAPKVSTMRLIRDIEPSPRHIYCGAIGVMSPGYERFSVAIRTALFRGGFGPASEPTWEEGLAEARDDRARAAAQGSTPPECFGEFGVGSGVVWDSTAEAEFDECLAKRDLLLKSAPPWELVEALAGHSLDDAWAVDAHLGRLGSQASTFGISFDAAALREELGRLPRRFPWPRPKVRIALRLDGTWKISCGPSAIAGEELHAALATDPVCSADPNLRMKTTSRSVLDEHLDEHADAEEVLLYNEHGLLTEFCRGNVVVRLDGALLTPRPESGCLAGLSVAALAAEGQVAYADVHVSELPRATEVWFINSVTGLVPVRIGHV